MGKAAAKQGDEIFSSSDMHLVVLPNGAPVPMAHVFSAPLTDGLSSNVNIMGKPAATVDSCTDNKKRHDPALRGRPFAREPTNVGTIKKGSKTVFINGKAAARDGDVALTCGDPNALVGKVKASGSVSIG